jgi:hypothetical protein
MNPAAAEASLARIRELNDEFRRTGSGGRIVMTAGIAALSKGTVAGIMTGVMTFDAFMEDNDPHGEHDFGSFEIEDVEVMWKIDYFDLQVEYGSEDPADPARTVRVLTVMRAEEY